MMTAQLVVAKVMSTKKMGRNVPLRGRGMKLGMSV